MMRKPGIKPKSEYALKLQNDSAVSPVVGVMLMLIVTIIIAAVVSAFAGGLVGGNNQKTPQLTVDTRLINGGLWSNSLFTITVTGEDQPIATKDLKIVTSWTKTLTNGTKITGGTTVVPGTYNYHVFQNGAQWAAIDDWWAVSPLGYGPGVIGNGTDTPILFFTFTTLDQSLCKGARTGETRRSGMRCDFSDIGNGAIGNESSFGNYNLLPGTVMGAWPLGGQPTNVRRLQEGAGAAYSVGYGVPSNATGTYTSTGGGPFNYAYGQDSRGLGTADGSYYAEFYPTMGVGTVGAAWHTTTQSEDLMQGVLGQNWNVLRAGDTVNLKIIYTPTGKTIVNKDVTVEG